MLSHDEQQIAGKSDIIKDFVEVINSSGDFTMIDGIDVYVKTLRNMLITPLGTYFMDPTYGSELHKKVFELSDDRTKEEIIYEVRDRITVYDSKIIIDHVSVDFYSDIKGFYITAYLRRNDVKGLLTMDLNEYNMGYSLE